MCGIGSSGFEIDQKDSFLVLADLQNGNETISFDFPLPLPADNKRQIERFVLKLQPVLEKNTFNRLTNCRGQVEGLSEDTMTSKAQDFEMGVYDRPLSYEFPIDHAPKMNDFYFHIVCDGAVTRWLKFTWKAN